MRKVISLLSIICILSLSLVNVSHAQAEDICIKGEEATDLIQILDASERNLELLESCSSLVDQLYKEIELRDQIIERLTEENIALKKQVRNLEKLRDREKVLRYAGIGAIVFAVIKVAASVAAL